jgi:hypothetical protein
MAKAIVTIPGVIGGLFGILIGGLELLWFIISAVSSHIPRSWIEGNIISPETGACIFILLGMIGAVSSLLYPVKKMNLGGVIILCGWADFRLAMPLDPIQTWAGQARSSQESC